MMDIFEAKETLSTFRVVIDRREHETAQAQDRYKSLGKTERATLDYGDYCGNVTLPDGSSLYDIQKRLYPSCVVERKMSLDEMAMCFTRGRERFTREIQRASMNSAKVYLLIEGGSWEGILNHRYKSRFHPEAFKASLMAFMVRYDMDVIFCRAGTSGEIIKGILYRNMKERLEEVNK